MKSPIENLLERIASKREEVTALTQALVRIPTVNPPGDGYEACARLIGERLSKKGFAVEYIRAHGAPGDKEAYPRTNVVARWNGQHAGECVHFNSHIDVVEPGLGWTFDPFAATVHNARVYGRGACDMKGGLAASIIAVESLIESGIPIHGALEISGTVDEESGGFAGVGYLAERGYFSQPRVHHVIIPEPLGVDRICLGHRGVWWGEVETKGRIAHGSMPFLGDSAINHMGAFIHLLETQLQPELLKRKSAQPVMPEQAKFSTLNINSVHGGQNEQQFQTDLNGWPIADTPAPTEAHSCRAVLDRRYIAEENLESVKQEIMDLLEGLKKSRKGFDYSVKDIMSFVPSATPRDAPVVEAVAQAIDKVLAKAPSYISSPGTYDQKHIVRSGKLYNCIAFGPGILDLAHQPDEYVGIQEMVDSAKIMALACLQLTRSVVTPSALLE